MLLRSSSTPVLGSLISSFSDSPNNNIHYHHEATNSKNQMFHHQNFNNKLPCLTTVVCCNSSPISSSLSESSKGIRRAQSDGNLEGLVYPSKNGNNELQHFTSPGQSKKLDSRRKKSLVLETIPSFSLCNLRLCSEDDEDYGDEEDEKDGMVNDEDSTFGFRNVMKNMVLDKEWTAMDRNSNVMFEERNGGFSEEMHLARGLGISGGGGNNGNGGSGGRGFNSAGGDGGDLNSTEEYYKKMVKENPGNTLFLRNYAQFLYQTKQDLQGAEEYYSRAILADPNDGEIISQYAKLAWELHRDQDRASTYFERAVQAAPKDSHVHAAYASFLWEIEEDENECFIPRDFDAGVASLHGGAIASAGS